MFNELGGAGAIEIRDDGTGISRQVADAHFSHLGGSWKAHAVTTSGGRQLHGRAGQGRWASYGLGEVVTWISVTQAENERSRRSGSPAVRNPGADRPVDRRRVGNVAPRRRGRPTHHDVRPGSRAVPDGDLVAGRAPRRGQYPEPPA
ncbi:ATP-binding protein [Polymorphospora sp. NPDC051019]|uniref:ATP-binding protein n=1 Tax=Polymorphospora sp. NPDC051019 TaxID=3155725 RepID=UPI00341F7611